MIQSDNIIEIVKYIPSSDRGSTRRCDACGVDLMLMESKYAYQIEMDASPKFKQLCEKCYVKFMEK